MEMLKRYKKRRREVRTARVCTEGYGEMRSVKQRYRQRGEILGVEVRQGGVWRAACREVRFCARSTIYYSKAMRITITVTFCVISTQVISPQHG